MKRLTIALSVLCTLAFGQIARCEDLDTISYPTTDHPSFEIQAPKTWKLKPAEEEGDFFEIDGPSGALFSFRTIEGSKEALNDAIDESVKDIDKQFKDVQLGEAKDWTPDGLKGMYAVGSGKDKDGSAIRVGVGWVALNDGKIAEMWFVADEDDEKGINEANAIANSLTSPKADKEDESASSDDESDDSQSDDSSSDDSKDDSQ
jgi:hypothetical protein